MGTLCQGCVHPCTECMADGFICTGCRLGYYLSNGMCIGMTSLSGCKGCLNCTDAITCYECDKGLYLSGTTCLPCLFGCNSCTNSTNCFGCQSGNYDSYFMMCVPYACVTRDAMNKCIQCPSGSYLNNDVCVTCINGCSTCTSVDICTSCVQGFVLLDNSCISKEII